MKRITNIQLFKFEHERQTSEAETEVVRSYSANLVIDDRFIVQVSGDKDESTFHGVCGSSDCYWDCPATQDLECIASDNIALKAELEREGFENNIGWLTDHADETH